MQSLQGEVVLISYLKFIAIIINSIVKASKKISNGISNPIFAAHWYSSKPIPILTPPYYCN